MHSIGDLLKDKTFFNLYMLFSSLLYIFIFPSNEQEAIFSLDNSITLYNNISSLVFISCNKSYFFLDKFIK